MPKKTKEKTSAFGATHPTIKFNKKEMGIFREEFAKGSRLARLPNGQRRIRYNTKVYPLAEHIRRLLVTKGLVAANKLERLKRLEDLHTILPESLMTLDQWQLNGISRAFYDTDSLFIATYESMLKNIIGPEIVGEAFVFQSTPTIRFHFPNERGFNWNPTFHTDIMLGHPPQEINLWLAICGARGSASMSIANMKDGITLLELFDFDFPRLAEEIQHNPDIMRRCAKITKPVELEYGKVLAFDSRCLHATQLNHTNWTRISLDFRIVPMDDYQAMEMIYRGVGRRQMLFRQGHYYDKRSSIEL